MSIPPPATEGNGNSEGKGGGGGAKGGNFLGGRGVLSRVFSGGSE